VDIDEMEKELKKASKAIDTGNEPQTRLQGLCDSALRKPAASTSEDRPQGAVVQPRPCFQIKTRRRFRR
jgi:hypothetical protein